MNDNDGPFEDLDDFGDEPAKNGKRKMVNSYEVRTREYDDGSKDTSHYKSIWGLQDLAACDQWVKDTLLLLPGATINHVGVQQSTYGPRKGTFSVNADFIVKEKV